jgi:outer membrane lipoprotein carrier protein
VPEDAQVVKRKASTVLQDTTPLSFLAGLGNLEKSFAISLAESKKTNNSGIILLDLVPRQPQTNIKKMQLKLEAKAYGVSGIVLIDPYGNTNDIDFVHIQLNQGMKEDTFQFTPPKGVDVVDGEAQNTEVPLNPLGH